jgi:hypothetical protein
VEKVALPELTSEMQVQWTVHVCVGLGTCCWNENCLTDR